MERGESSESGSIKGILVKTTIQTNESIKDDCDSEKERDLEQR